MLCMLLCPSVSSRCLPSGDHATMPPPLVAVGKERRSSLVRASQTVTWLVNPETRYAPSGEQAAACTVSPTTRTQRVRRLLLSCNQRSFVRVFSIEPAREASSGCCRECAKSTKSALYRDTRCFFL